MTTGPADLAEIWERLLEAKEVAKGLQAKMLEDPSEVSPEMFYQLVVITFQMGISLTTVVKYLQDEATAVGNKRSP